MRTKFLGIAIAAMTIIALPSVADNKSKVSNDKAEKSCCQDSQKQRPGLNPFEGLNLTDAQQAKLKELGEKRKAERAEKMQKAKEERKAAREKAQAIRPDLKAAKKEKLNEVKSILTADQYVQYLENMVINTPSQARIGMQGKRAMKGKMQNNRPGRDGKGFRGSKTQNKQAQPQADTK